MPEDKDENDGIKLLNEDEINQISGGKRSVAGGALLNIAALQGIRRPGGKRLIAGGALLRP